MARKKIVECPACKGNELQIEVFGTVKFEINGNDPQKIKNEKVIYRHTIRKVKCIKCGYETENADDVGLDDVDLPN